MKKEKSKRITLYIDNDIYLNFKMYAVSINKSVSEIVEKFMKEIEKGDVIYEENNIKKLG